LELLGGMLKGVAGRLNDLAGALQPRLEPGEA
jgi:hypothetical protein